MQHEHQAATAKGPQSSSGSVSLACPLFVVPFFAAASAEQQQAAVARVPPPRRRPSAAFGLSWTRTSRSGARLQSRRNVPACRPRRPRNPRQGLAAVPRAGLRAAANGGGLRNLTLQLGRSGAAAPGGGPAAAARPRRGPGAVMLRTSAVAASPPGAGKKHMSSSHSNHSISKIAGGTSGPAAALATLMPHGR